MSRKSPTVAIITVCFNSLETIAKTIESVRRQSVAPDEFIVIDGASTDGTLDLIEESADCISTWISEPDRGISDAMNKGVKRSTADFILFLHSDDYLVDQNVIETVKSILGREHDIVGFPIYFETSAGRELRFTRPFGLWTNIKSGIQHQGIFCHRRVIEAVGSFDEEFGVAMDYDFFLRAKRMGYTLITYKQPVVSVMRDTGISSVTDPKTEKWRFSEEKRVHHKNSSGGLMKLLYQIWWGFYPGYRRIKGLLKS